MSNITDEIKHLTDELKLYEGIKAAAFKVTQNWCFEAISKEDAGDCVVPKAIMQELHESFTISTVDHE